MSCHKQTVFSGKKEKKRKRKKKRQIQSTRCAKTFTRVTRLSSVFSLKTKLPNSLSLSLHNHQHPTETVYDLIPFIHIISILNHAFSPAPSYSSSSNQNLFPTKTQTCDSIASRKVSHICA